jgi:hypothetical protein
MNPIATRSLAAAFLASSSFASTWIVDDTAGPGVQFTDIGSAIAVAAPGDVILVRPGTYAGFTLHSGVLVLGDANVQVTSNITIANVGPGPRATIARMTTRDVVVTNCAGKVTIEDVLARLSTSVPVPGLDAIITVQSCGDVRLRGVDARFTFGGPALEAVSVESSRVEITHSTLLGQDGFHSSDQGNGIPGGDGLFVAGASDVHVGLSTVRGGQGEVSIDDITCPLGCLGGNGGAGIRTSGIAARLLVTGVAANLVRGGNAGLGMDCAHDGAPGNAVFVSPGVTARLSGATLEGATYALDCGGAHVAAVSGLFAIPTPADPSLEVSGTIAQGQPVTYTVHGAPGSAVRLRLGRQMIVQDLLDAYEDRLTVPLRTYDLGVMPVSGDVSFGFTLPGGLARGFLVVAQASTISPSGVTLTQSVPITLH